jgi:hypothetical protein
MALGPLRQADINVDGAAMKLARVETSRTGGGENSGRRD